eukprot:gene2179-3091_t
MFPPRIVHATTAQAEMALTLGDAGTGDILFVAEGRRIYAHKGVVSRCMYFAEFLAGNPTATKITIQPAPYEAVYGVLRHLYDEAPVVCTRDARAVPPDQLWTAATPRDVLLGAWEVSLRLQLPQVVDHVAGLLPVHLSHETVCQIFSCFFKYRQVPSQAAEALQQACTAYVLQHEGNLSLQEDYTQMVGLPQIDAHLTAARAAGAAESGLVLGTAPGNMSMQPASEPFEDTAQLDRGCAPPFAGAVQPTPEKDATRIAVMAALAACDPRSSPSSLPCLAVQLEGRVEGSLAAADQQGANMMRTSALGQDYAQPDASAGTPSVVSSGPAYKPGQHPLMADTNRMHNAHFPSQPVYQTVPTNSWAPADTSTLATPYHNKTGMDMSFAPSPTLPSMTPAHNLSSINTPAHATSSNELSLFNLRLVHQQLQAQ